MDQDTAHFREPTQKRSIERVNLILEAARALIAEHGSAGLKIREIADKAGITAGSMYQYFPNKAAIIQALGQRYLNETAAILESKLQPPPRNGAELLSFINQMFDTYYQMHLNDPVIQDIWMGTHADKTLQAIDDADIQRNTETIYSACKPLFLPDREEEIRNAILLALKFTNTTIRVALAQTPTKAEMTIGLFKQMIAATIQDFLRE